MGVVTFTNVNITTDSTATTAFLAGGNQNNNVMGNSNLTADGGGSLVLINIGQINMTFDTITALAKRKATNTISTVRLRVAVHQICQSDNASISCVANARPCQFPALLVASWPCRLYLWP